ncbi:MAG: AI-2E family transporter [Nitrospira sp. BO4]|jgi:predicted PurR-regulated permease PerM|nr:AI-2E family transporter [Nitrospira sp. BO4]
MSSLHPAPVPRTPPVPTPPPTESTPHKAGIDRHLWEIRPIRDLFILGAMVGLLWFLFALHQVFLPVFVALLLAYLVNPFVDYAFTRWKTPRPVTVGILMLFLALAGVGIGLWLIPLLVEQAETLIQKIPVYARNFSQRYETMFGSWSISLGDFLGRLHDDPLATIQPLLSGTGQAFGLLGQLLGITANVALYAILIPVYFFFFAWNFESMSRTIVRLVPVSHRPHTLHVLRRMDTVVRGFFFERLLIAVITGVLYAGGWSFAGVPYWFLLGIVTGLASLVPYLSAIGWPVAVALKYADALTTGQWATTDWMTIVLWPSVAYLIVQFLEGWVLTPWLQRHSTDMSAATILIVVFMGGAVGGLFGLIFAIPVAACLKIVVDEFVRPRWLRWVREA